jgi:hypothetical protein
MGEGKEDANEEGLSSFSYPEHRGRKYIQNTDNDLSNYRVSHPRRQ